MKGRDEKRRAEKRRDDGGVVVYRGAVRKGDGRVRGGGGKHAVRLLWCRLCVCVCCCCCCCCC